MSLKERADEKQQAHAKLGVGIATLMKFREDNSTNLASMIAFWAFFSIFPLFLAMVTILGYVLPAGTRKDVLDKVANLFPLIDPSSIGALSGAWWPVLIGVLGALWSGTGVIRGAQFAFNSVWEVPQKDRPGLIQQVGRSLIALVTIGGGLVVATLISGLVTGKNTGLDLGPAAIVGGYVVALALDIFLFVVAFRMLTERDLTVRDVLPGAVLSGTVFFVLQQVSSLIVSRYLQNAQSTYGNFATVITILFWFYLQANVTLFGAQLNVVLKERLHPRSLFGGPDTEADHRALQAYAEERTYHEEEDVDARIEGRPLKERAQEAPRHSRDPTGAEDLG